MKVVVIARRNMDRPAEDFAKFSSAEVRKAFEFVVEGTTREIYSMANGAGAVLICEGDSAEAVEAKLSQLPFCQNGLLTLEIIPLTAYRGFQMALEGGLA